jgi:hypothetical protein
MYLRFARRIKKRKEHRYWSIVESKRCAGGKVVQRPVLYLGEINESQHADWCRVIETLDADNQRYRQLALFPADRNLPESAADGSIVALAMSVTMFFCPAVLGRRSATEPQNSARLETLLFSFACKLERLAGCWPVERATINPAMTASASAFAFV